MSTNPQTKLVNLPIRSVKWSSSTLTTLRQLLAVDQKPTDEQLRLGFLRLSEVDQNILSHRLGLDDQEIATLPWIGKQVGLSRSRTGQLQQRAQKRYLQQINRLLASSTPAPPLTKDQQARSLHRQLDLSMHITHRLVSQEITTIKQLCALTAGQIANIRNIGSKRIAEIEAALAKRGLALTKADDMGGP